MGESSENTRTPQRLRFTEHDNIYLLREVIQNNPFQDPTGWEKIQKNLQIATRKTYIIKTLKNRIERLLEQFIKDDERDQKRSGLEEPQTEKDLLLCEIAVLASEYKGRKAKKVSKQQQIAEIGKQVRAKYAESFKIVNNKENQNLESYNIKIQGVQGDHCYADLADIPVENEVDIPFEDKDHRRNEVGFPSTSNYAGENITPLKETNIQVHDAPIDNPERRILVPSRKRQRRDPAVKKSCLNYLNDKQEKDREIKLKEVKIQEKQLELEDRRLCLEERKLCLEEKKFDLEMKEREHKLIIEKERVKLELEDKRITTKLLDAQQIIIDHFCKSLNQESQ